MKNQVIIASPKKSKGAKIEAQKKQVEKINHLKEGVTGKQLQAEKIKANKSNKDELKTFSFQQGQFFKHGQNFLKCFNNCPKLESKAQFDKFFNPSVLNKFLTENERAKIEAKKLEGINENYSFYLFENLVSRYLKSL
jgi:hypothetical protein